MVNEGKPKISLMKLGLPTQLHPTPLTLSKIFSAKKLILTHQGFSTLALLTFGTQCPVPCTVGYFSCITCPYLLHTTGISSLVVTTQNCSRYCQTFPCKDICPS